MGIEGLANTNSMPMDLLMYLYYRYIVIEFQLPLAAKPSKALVLLFLPPSNLRNYER